MWGEPSELCKNGGKSLEARRGWLDNAIITQQTESHGGGSPQSDWSELSHRRGFVSSQLQTHSARRSQGFGFSRRRRDALTQDSSLSVELLQFVRVWNQPKRQTHPKLERSFYYWSCSVCHSPDAEDFIFSVSKHLKVWSHWIRREILWISMIQRVNHNLHSGDGCLIVLSYLWSLIFQYSVNI